jgi:predicted deacylase
MGVDFMGVKPAAGRIIHDSLKLDGVHIPIVLAAGAADGRALVVHCAQHQTEYSGSAMIGQLLAGLDLAAVRGLLVVLPLVNVPLILRTRLPQTFPAQAESNKANQGTVRSNINRVWPGVKDGTWNERLAWTLSHEVFVKADAVLDFHSCRLCDACFSSYVVSSRPSREIALAFGLEMVDETPEEGYFPGQLHSRVPIELGVPAILVEMSPTSGQVSWAAMQQARRGVLNVMKHLGMLAGAPELPPRQVVFHRAVEKVMFSAGQIGFAVTYCRPGQVVRQGDLVAEVRSFKDFSVLEPHRAPCDGALASCGPHPSHVVLPGEELATMEPGAEIIDN